MSDKFQNKYRIPSARLQTWDYGWNAAYFVTICTKDRVCNFGNIVETRLIASPQGLIASPQEMQLSELGEMAQRYWMEIPDHFPFVILDDFVIMPNHIHGIIIINKNDDGQRGIDGWDDEHQRRDAINRVSTETEPKIKTGGFAGNKNPMKNDNLSRIIRWYKGRVSFECRQIHADFAWQSRFHDHIIRDEKSLHNIRNYIFENPLKWDNDEYFMLIS